MNDRSCETYNAKDVTALIEQNERVRVEIEKAQLKSKVSCVTSDSVKPKVLAPGMYAIDVKPIPPPLKNNRSAHLNYINHLKESVETVKEIVEEARVVKPLDNALNYACQYTKLSQKLLEYVIGTCPKEFNTKDNKATSTPLTRKKQVTFNDTCETSTSNKCLISESHDICVIKPLNYVNATSTVKNGLNKVKQAVQIVLWYMDSGCSKHMMGNCSKLKKFVKKLLGKVRFRNDHFGAIMGYGE
ncbi:hypothetical protein Tco_1513139 [Tanacetum coccineum]